MARWTLSVLPVPLLSLGSKLALRSLLLTSLLILSTLPKLSTMPELTTLPKLTTLLVPLKLSTSLTLILLNWKTSMTMALLRMETPMALIIGSIPVPISAPVTLLVLRATISGWLRTPLLSPFLLLKLLLFFFMLQCQINYPVKRLRVKSYQGLGKVMSQSLDKLLVLPGWSIHQVRGIS